MKPSFFTRITATGLAVMLSLSLLAEGTAHGAESTDKNLPVSVYFDDNRVDFHDEPVLLSGTVYADASDLLAALGFYVEDTAEENENIIRADSLTTSLQLELEAGTLLVNGQLSRMAQQPIVVEDEVFVPIRQLCQQLGLTVAWRPDLRQVVIDYPIPSSEEQAALHHLFDQLKATSDSNDLDGFMALFEEQSFVYENMALRKDMLAAEDIQTTMDLSHIELVTFTRNQAFYSMQITTRRAEGEPRFVLERRDEVKMIIKRQNDGTWKISDSFAEQTEFLNAEEALQQAPAVPAAEKQAILAVVEANVQATNDKDIALLASTYRLHDSELKWFEDSSPDDVTLTLEEAKIIAYEDGRAHVSVIQTEEWAEDEEKYRFHYVFKMMRSPDGKWQIDTDIAMLSYEGIEEPASGPKG